MDREGILKEAILLERRGKAFYERVAETTESAPVREVFSTMAGEEEKHIEILSGLGSGELSVPEEGPGRIADSVLTGRITGDLEAAGYEAAAIYAAMAMEEKAVEFYSKQAEEATGQEKELFAWLADWERTHLDLLRALNEDLRQRVWEDQRFWPF